MTPMRQQILKLINYLLNALSINQFIELHPICEMYIFDRTTQN
jgi:hypothetical protein